MRGADGAAPRMTGFGATPPLPLSRRPALRVACAILLQDSCERFVEPNPLFVGDDEQNEEDIGQLHREILLGLARLLRLVPKAVIHLARELAHLLDETRQIRERRPITLFEP